MSTAIAKNYLDFEDYYKIEHKKMLNSLNELNQAELVYRAIKAALEATRDDYPQVFKISRYGKYFSVSCEMLTEQHYSDFFHLAKELGKQLSQRGLRNGETPDAYLESSVTWNYRARIDDKTVFSIALILHCNIMGNKYRIVNERKVQKLEIVTTYRWLEKPIYSVDATLKGAITEENITLKGAITEDNIRELYKAVQEDSVMQRMKGKYYRV